MELRVPSFLLAPYLRYHSGDDNLTTSVCMPGAQGDDAKVLPRLVFRNPKHHSQGLDPELLCCRVVGSSHLRARRPICPPAPSRRLRSHRRINSLPLHRHSRLVLHALRPRSTGVLAFPFDIWTTPISVSASSTDIPASPYRRGHAAWKTPAMFPLIETAAAICLVWSIAIITVQLVGVGAVFRYFSRPPKSSVSSRLGKDAPAVTIIRPVKGLEPHLYGCIASTFQQDYPSDKVSIRLCIEDENDAAYPILSKLVDDFPAFDVQVLLESCDPALHGPDAYLDLGPNPKIRNISRAYREAKGDIIWIIDCNVWASTGVLGRMVDKLTGLSDSQRPVTPYKFVHQMPFLVDTADCFAQARVPQGATGPEPPTPTADGTLARICRKGGGRLDEMFFGTTHVKFYGAINAVGIAPCIVGKSNMFRKSHLDQVTTPSRNPLLDQDNLRPPGVDYFSHNICEDHLIGDLLWRSNIPSHQNHGMVWGDLAVQPMAGMSIAAYAARRIRWLRARKLTVLVATLVEPGVESLVCCAYLSFVLTTLPWFRAHLGIPQTWSAAALIWMACVVVWMCVDRVIFRLLHSGVTVEVDKKTPSYARGTSHTAGIPPRMFGAWLLAWLGRELLALPVWTWAVLFGTTVKWRGKTFHVRLDASVVEVTNQTPGRKGSRTPELERAKKDRVD